MNILSYLGRVKDVVCPMVIDCILRVPRPWSCSSCRALFISHVENLVSLELVLLLLLLESVMLAVSVGCVVFAGNGCRASCSRRREKVETAVPNRASIAVLGASDHGWRVSITREYRGKTDGLPRSLS